MARDDYLFNTVDWFSVERNQRENLTKEISSYNGDRLLNTSVDDLCDYFVEKFQIIAPTLNEDNMVADQNEVEIDVSRDPMRGIRDRSQPFYIKGTEIEVTIPFDGESEAFKIQPTSSSMNPPRAIVRNQVLILKVQGTDLSPESVQSSIQNTITSINQYLSTLTTNVSGWNSTIRQQAKQQIESRREKLLGDKSLLGALGFPMKERVGAEKTYQAPNVQRKIKPSAPQATSAPYKPEPAMASEDYDHIIGVIESMANVMERSPSAFKSMNEEALRSHFLVQLNGHYEGQATGETFNYEGKTDILVRSEGKNIFIGECKYWSGPKNLLETIDQILGYSSWRDTKVAILIFNQRKDFSKVLEAIPGTVEGHENYKRSLEKRSETQFRFIVCNRDDPNQEMLLTVLAFDVPV